MKLSVVIPCFNETATLESCVDRVLAADTLGLEVEVLIVDDASSDGSVEIAQGIADRESRVRVLRHERNQGKGAALRTGFQGATGDIIIIQDADLEYDPSEFSKLIVPILDDRADVVYGSRFSGSECHRVLYFWHSVGNNLLTLLSNMLSDLKLTDMETCYKVFRSEIIKNLNLQEDKFGFEPEVTAKLSRLNPRPRIYEVGIGYSGRSYSEGKKINWRDGVWAVYCIFRYNLFG